MDDANVGAAPLIRGSFALVNGRAQDVSLSSTWTSSGAAGRAAPWDLAARVGSIISQGPGADERRPRSWPLSGQARIHEAVLYRRPTKVFQDLVGQGGPNLRLLRLSGASPLEGGIPIQVDGKIVGAVGVSGATSEQDAQVAKAGADALTK